MIGADRPLSRVEMAALGQPHRRRLHAHGLRVVQTSDLEEHLAIAAEDAATRPAASRRKRMVVNPAYDPANHGRERDDGVILTCLTEADLPAASLAMRLVEFGPEPLRDITSGRLHYGRETPDCRFLRTQPVQFVELAGQRAAMLGGLWKRPGAPTEIITPLWRLMMVAALGREWSWVVGVQDDYNVRVRATWPEGFRTISWCLMWAGPPAEELALTTMTRYRAAEIAACTEGYEVAA